VTLTPDANGTYPQFSTQTRIWPAGVALGVTAPAGAEVGSISATAKIPTSATISAPVPPGAATRLAVPRSQGFDVTATGASD